MRLQEIKDRNGKYSASRIRYVEHDDLEWLFNRIERYEKSLERIIELYNEYGDGEWIVSHGMSNIAEEALKDE